jgi:hypothetical protein
MVHHLMMTRAYEPLASVGPVVYMSVLGERVTERPVQLRGEVDARQGARTGQSLLDFYNEGGASGVSSPPPPPEPPKDNQSAKPAKNARAPSKASAKSSRR